MSILPFSSVFSPLLVMYSLIISKLAPAVSALIKSDGKKIVFSSKPLPTSFNAGTKIPSIISIGVLV